MRSHRTKRSGGGWAFCAVVLALVACGRAGPLKVLVVDPAHTDAGDAAVAALSSDAEVRRVDVTELRQSPPPDADVVVWLSPEPSLYEGEARQRWRDLVASRNVGLLIVGLPHDAAGREKLAEILRPRAAFAVGPALDRHLDGAKWIWTSKTPQDDQTVVLRKTFQLESPPHRAFLQVAADNRAVASVNGHKLGVADDWRRPAAFDLTRFLRAGENEVTLEATNEDGPAGVIAAVSGCDATGAESFRIVTDQTWPGAAVIAPLGGGPWEDGVRAGYGADEYLLHNGPSDGPLSLPAELGRLAVLYPLRPGRGAITLLRADDVPVAIAGEGGGGRLILLAGDPGKTSSLGGTPSFVDAGLGVFVRAGVRWLANQPVPREAMSQPASRPATQPARTLNAKTFFPVTMQFSPIPYEGVPTPTDFPDSPSALHRIVDNLIDHGCTLLQCPLPLPEPQAREVERYAQARGMGITYLFEHGLEGFGRERPPAASVYSDAYRRDLRQRLDARLKVLDRYPNLFDVLPFLDEPFHVGVESFDARPEHARALQERYGFESPATQPTPADPQWSRYVDVNTLDFPAGWAALYDDFKRRYPRVEVVMNHDSHNVFGGAVGQEGTLNLDDVFHWGSRFADVLSFDIYPYLMKDFRYGPNREFRRPRMAQMHYALAQMRETARAGARRLGFYFGTYNPEWFALTPLGRTQYWMEREMIYTAVAGGTDELYAGLNVPIDARHWEDAGDALRTLQKASPDLLAAPPVASPAAMLFPREQVVRLQEEYWNVGTSFETFQRAFGQLDVIHEEQLNSNLEERKLLALFDVKLLKPAAEATIRKWLDGGGAIVADCVPHDTQTPPRSMNEIFGVRAAGTDRILWPAKMKPEIDSDRPATMPAATQPTDCVHGRAFGREFDFPIVSPRPCTVTDGEVLLKTAAGRPALVRRMVGKGRTYLLGFCLQDTAFEAWRTSDRRTLDQLNHLLLAITEDAGVRPIVRSSNPDIEAALRRGAGDAFLVVIAHEPTDPATRVTLRGFPTTPKQLTDVATGEPVLFTAAGDGISIDLTLPTGATRLLRLR